MSDKKTIQTERSSETDIPTEKPAKKLPKEIGGREGPEPTRYGDWERKGIISDF
jgi:hypothetical protein